MATVELILCISCLSEISIFYCLRSSVLKTVVPYIFVYFIFPERIINSDFVTLSGLDEEIKIQF